MGEEEESRYATDLLSALSLERGGGRSDKLLQKRGGK